MRIKNEGGYDIMMKVLLHDLCSKIFFLWRCGKSVEANISLSAKHITSGSARSR